MSVVYVIVTFLMVERALVTFTETVTTSLNEGEVGLIIGVPITGGGLGGGAWARAKEPIAKRVSEAELVDFVLISWL